MPAKAEPIRIAAVADLHCAKTSAGVYRPLFEQAAKAADVLLLCGDLTDYGLPEEAEVLAADLKAALQIPVIAVLGNHDYESGRQEEIAAVLSEAGVVLLNGGTCEFHGIGFAGTKGFAGGFGRGSLGYWGEPAIKAFVQEALNEALKLETAVAHLSTEQRIAILHYAPIRETLEGESPEILPYLGSSRLEEPLGRFPVTAVFHGHAHAGKPEGQTATGTPVYNVSLPVLRQHYPDQPPFRVLKVPRPKPVKGAASE